MTQLPHDVRMGIRYSDGRIHEMPPNKIEWVGDHYEITARFYNVARGTVTDGGIKVFGVWAWKPMMAQTFNGERKWSWRRFWFVDKPTGHTLTVTYTWRQTWA